MENHSKSSKKILVGFCLLLIINVFGQNIEQLNQYKVNYPGSLFIVKTQKNKVSITLEKGVPKIVHSSVQEYIILDKSAVTSLAEDEIGFSSFEKLSNIEAYSENPEGSKSKKIYVKEFKTKDADQEGYIFHDDSKVINFIYPGLIEGSMTHLSYDDQMSTHHFPIGFHFYGKVPIENPEFIIECDTNIHLAFFEYHLKEYNIVSSKKLLKNKWVYTYSADKAMQYKSEDFSPNSRYYCPHVLAHISSYNTPKGIEYIGRNPEDLYKYNYTHIQEVINEVQSDELKTLSDSITLDLQNDFEKVKAIYYWVQENVKYVAFEEGIGGFVPRQPTSIIEKRYGDCKDMASLIYAMTKAVNIKTNLTWVGSRDLPYKYTEMPNGTCDNHMIATYLEGDKVYYLDATNSFLNINMPNSFIQGKECMASIDKDNYKIFNIPISKPEETTSYDSSYIELNDRSMIGKTYVELSGYYLSEIGLYSKYIKAEDLDEFFDKIGERGNNSLKCTNAAFTENGDRHKNIKMVFDWTVNNYATKVGKDFYVNTIIHKDFVKYPALEPDRVAPLEFEHCFSDKYVVNVKIPTDYKIKYIPKNVNYESDQLKISVSYEQKDGFVLTKISFSLKTLMIEKKDFDKWAEFQKIKKEILTETLVLTKK